MTMPRQVESCGRLGGSWGSHDVDHCENICLHVHWDMDITLKHVRMPYTKSAFPIIMSRQEVLTMVSFRDLSPFVVRKGGWWRIWVVDRG